MSIVSAEDVSCAMEVIEKDGYVILENAVSTQVAEEWPSKMPRLHGTFRL